ncbi:mitochondrial proton/calcium exchanger protein isoform X2 [Hyalella azteca]|uniref:Mitochondrial proton/calcium exchanger protein isoform X2 n=1 Tax=Hyalella azteca TaxID=294128 RepID=A0A8B7NZE4_HYAAZ|nr:mitochondrial proton/calcium exchanger protein isoform X2 [Hyalella azteca]
MLSRRLLQKRECWHQLQSYASVLPPCSHLTQYSTSRHCKKYEKKLLESNFTLSHPHCNWQKISTIAKEDVKEDDRNAAATWITDDNSALEKPTISQGIESKIRRNGAFRPRFHSYQIPSSAHQSHLYSNHNLTGINNNSLNLVRTSRPGMLGVARPIGFLWDTYSPSHSSLAISAQGPASPYQDLSNSNELTVSISNFNPEIYFTYDSDLRNGLISKRFFHTTTCFLDSKPPSSQVEVTVNALKEKAESLNQEKIAASASKDASQAPIVTTAAAMQNEVPTASPTRSETINLAIAKSAPPLPSVVAEKKSLWTRIKAEAVHYYHGFRLLFIDTKIALKYCYRILNGEKLSRREHRQLVRTTGDLFRLLPFSVFIIVPFMEFLLPVALKLFPGMLPSTFETANEKEAKMKKRLKVKLEMAKFLQETLDSMSLQSKDHHSKSAQEFVLFFEKVRRTGEVVSNEEILKFSKLFADSITLDSLSRPQLTALCRLLEMQTFGTNNFLRFQLRMKLRSLAADDKLIAVEGVDSLSSWELQQACRSRGMRAYGMTDTRLRVQLQQWLELSLDKKVPPSLLLLSRTLYLPDTLDANASLAATISQLPDEIKTRTKAAIGKREGKIDNRTRLEVIQVEEKRIEEDKKDMQEEKKKKMLEEAKKMGELGIGEAEVVSVAPASPAVGAAAAEAVVAQAVKVTKATVTPAGEIKEDKEELVDRAPVLVDTAEELRLEREDQELKLADHKLAEEKAKKEKSEELSSEDLAEVEEALETLGTKQRRLLIEEQELLDIKDELRDYQEDIEDFKQVVAQFPERTDLRESKAARRLFAKVNRLIAKTEPVIAALNAKTEEMHKVVEAGQATKLQKTTLVNLEDLVTHLRQVADAPDSAKLQVIMEVLSTMDTDNDGSIKLEHILKTIELLSEDQVEVPRKVFEEVVQAMAKEEQLETKTVVQTAIKAVAASKLGADTPPAALDAPDAGVAEQKQL